MLHHVDLDVRQRRAGCVGHRVDPEVEGWIVGHERPDFQPRIATERRRNDVDLGADDCVRDRLSGERLVRFFDDDGSCAVRRDDRRGRARRQVAEPAGSEPVLADAEQALQHVQEPLVRTRRQRAAGLELRRVHHEAGPARP
jgi:hypothetical protein